MKKILSLVLVAVMLISLMPLSVFADGKATGYGLKLVISKDTETFKEAENAVSKTVLRLDIMYTSGSNESTSQLLSVDYDATKLEMLDLSDDPDFFGISGEYDLTNYYTYSDDTASTYVRKGKEYYTKASKTAKRDINELCFYSIISNGIGYMTFHITEGSGALPYNKEVTGSDYSTLASVYFALKEGVSFDDLPTDLFWFSDLSEDKDITKQSNAISISDGKVLYAWGCIDSADDTLDISPEFTPGEGVTFHTEKVDAVAPVISAQPTGSEYIKGATAEALSVTASVTDAGTLSYKWYKNTENSTTGGSEVGTEATYTPATTDVGTAYYFVVVTNTNDAATGTKTASVTSNAVAVTVSEDPDVLALNAAAEAIKDLTYEMAQADATDEAAIKTFIKTTAEAAITNGVTVSEVTKSSYTPAVAGTSAAPAGTNGTYEFTLTLSKNSKTLSPDALYTLTIKATAFTGTTDVQAVAAAKAAIKDGEANVSFKADAEERYTKVKALVDSQLTGVTESKGVAIVIELKSNNVYTVKLSKGSVNDAKDITVTFNEAPDPNIAVADAAKTVANGATYSETTQAKAPDEDAVKAEVKETAETAVNNNDVTVEIVKVSYTAPEAGTSAKPAGTDGEFKFKVKVTAGEITRETDEKTVVIKATVYDGLTDKQAVANAVEAIGKIKWDDIAQADGNTEEKVKTLIENKLEDIDYADITVTVSDFTAAVEGTAATSHEGTNGSFKFTVKVQKNAENATPITDKELEIIATEFKGVLDTDAVAAAKDAIKDGEVIVPFGSDQAAKTAAVQKHIDSYLTGDAEGVKAEITGVSGNVYTVKLTKGAVVDTKDVTITVTESADPDIEIIANAVKSVEEITWQDVPDTVFNTEDGAKEYVENAVKNEIKNEEIDVTVITNLFTAAVDSNAASKDHKGTDGIFKFDVKLIKGLQSGEDKDNTINILAQDYEGLLDCEAVANAVEAIGKLTWEDIAQADGNTEEKVKTLIENKLEDIENVDITVTVSDFTAAVAGSAATSHEGTEGSFKFTVIVKKNAENATPITDKELEIIATEFKGVLDTEAVAAAKAALENGEVTVAFGADQTAKTAAVQKHIDSYLTGDAEGVKAEITGVSGNVYTVKLTKGAVVDTKDVTITVTESADPDIALVAQAFAAVDGQTYSNGKQKNIYTEELAANKIKKLATTALTSAEITSGIDVTVETVSFTAAVAGDADTTAEGVNGEYKFKVKVTATKGTPSETTAEKTIAITATAYEGVMNIDAVNAAANALKDKEITVRHGASATEKTNALNDYLKSVLTGTAEGVTEDVKNDGNSYTVTFTKGTKSVTKTVTIVVEEEKFIDLAKVNGLKYEDRVLYWNPVPKASYYKVYVMALPETNIERAQVYTTRLCQLDMTDKLADGVSYTFKVCAMGDWVTYADGPVSDLSAPFTYKRLSAAEWNMWWILYQLQTKVSVITAEAGEGGTISNAGDKNITYTEKLKYVITPDEGYEIEAVYVNGKNVGALDLYVFAKVEKNQTIKATFKKIASDEWVNPFEDVAETDEYFEAIKFVNENGLYNGVSETKFAPHSTMTRAMFVTVLGRLAGVDTEKYTETSFDDAELGQWYSAYVEWAADNGIVNGYGNGKFGVNDEVTVEQAAAIIARYARFVGIDTADATLDEFEDAADLSDWAVADMAWLTEFGVYVPKDQKLAPRTKAERALVATMMFNFSVKFASETED